LVLGLVPGPGPELVLALALGPGQHNQQQLDSPSAQLPLRIIEFFFSFLPPF